MAGLGVYNNPTMLQKKLTAMLRLLRPELPLAAGTCTVAGQILALGRLPPLGAGALAFACVFCISASALVLNDYFDLEVDRVNAPNRPLPSGLVTPNEVIGLGVLLTLAGLLAAGYFGLPALLLCLLLWLVGFLYNWRFKQSGLPGNLMVSTSVGATFAFGAFSVQDPWNRVAWVFALIAFFVDLGEEIAGDGMDMEGDRLRSSRSIALLRGRRFALRLAVGLWGVVILLTLSLIPIGFSQAKYLAIILGTVALVGWFSVQLLRSKSADEGHRAMRGVYLGQTLIVVAFIIGRLTG